MRRSFLLMILLIGAVVGTTRAQESPLSTPAPSDQTNKPRAKSPLTEEQRAQMEQRLNDAWAKMPVETKSRLMRLHRALSEMPPEERKFVHDRIERFLNMSQAEREKLKQNKQKWEQMTPEERQTAREEFRKHRQEFEQQWNRTHPGDDPTPNESKAPSTPEGNTAPAPAPSPAP